MGARPAAVLTGIALLAGYFGLAAWLTWPLSASLGSSLPSEGYSLSGSHFDLYYSTWVLAHGSHALTSAASFADANIYHPASDALFYGPAALGSLPLFAPVFLATGNPVLAINLTFLLGVALTGVTMHVVVRRWTGSHLAGAIAAATVVLNQWLIRGFVPSAPHWASLYCLPLIAFVAARMESRRAILLLAPLVALQSLTDLVYLAPAVFGPLGVLALVELARRGTRAAGLRTLAALALASLALVPVIRGYRTVQAANPELATQTKWTNPQANVPAVLPDRLFSGGVPFLLTSVVLVLVALGLAAAAWRRRTASTPPGAKAPTPGAWTHGALWALVGGVLALNPVVLIGGAEFHTPLGHLAEWFPSMRVIRAPSRLGIAGLVGLGILAGAAFAEIAALVRARVPRRGVAHALSGALAVLVLGLLYRAYAGNYWDPAQQAAGPMPGEYRVHVPPPTPDNFRSVLAAERTPLLELPLGNPVNPRGHALAMLHSIAHWRPILNGYSSYWPAGFPERMVEACRLPDRGALDHLVESTGLALIWVHTQWFTPAERVAWASPPAADGRRRGLKLVAREGPELLFAVDPPPKTAPSGG